MKTEKAALRKQLIEQIQELPSNYINESNEGIFNTVINIPEFTQAKTIFCYYSLGREPDTTKLIEYALSLGKTVTLPVCLKNGIMEARVITSTKELTEARFHLLEPLSSTQVIQPEALDFVIVPAVTFDFEGYRLGRGGGYYDRFLQNVTAYTVGIARERLMMDRVPREKHDMPVRCVATEKKARLH